MTDALVQFLRDRLDEDEELRRGARSWSDRDWQVIASSRDDRVTIMDEANVIAWMELDGEPGQRIAAHIVRNDPAKAQADIDAKRRILDECGWAVEHGGGSAFVRPVLRLLALPYRDHLDYESDWAPL